MLVSFWTLWAQEQGKGKGVMRTTEPWSAYPWSRAYAQLRQCSMGGHRREPRADNQEFECSGRCRQGWQASRQCPSSLSVSPRTGPGYSPGRRIHLENNKTRIKVRTSRVLLATGTCLSENRGSKTKSSALIKTPVNGYTFGRFF